MYRLLHKDSSPVFSLLLFHSHADCIYSFLIAPVNLPRCLIASLVASFTDAVYQVFLEMATDNFGHLFKFSKQLSSLLAASISCSLVGLQDLVCMGFFHRYSPQSFSCHMPRTLLSLSNKILRVSSSWHRGDVLKYLVRP